MREITDEHRKLRDSIERYTHWRIKEVRIPNKASYSFHAVLTVRIVFRYNKNKM